jgi:Zn-dependent protease with chaperone function
VSYSPSLVSIPSGAANPARRSNPAFIPVTPPRTVSLPTKPATILLATYALFLAFRLTRFAWIWMRTSRIRDGAHFRSAPPLVEQVHRRCQEVLGLRHVELLCSPGISGPVVAGGAIILPERLFNETSEDVLSTAIGHEMAHIARRDFPGKVLYELLPCPFTPSSSATPTNGL